MTGLLLLAACGLKEVLPSGPVSGALPASARAFTYTGEPRVPFPVIPFQVFGLRYAVDLVVVTKDPDWDMHEYARIDLDGRALWIAKDTDAEGVQTILADLGDIESWLPEIPVPRVRAPLQVSEVWEDDRLRLDLSYTNIQNEPVRLELEAKLPDHPPAKRNGNTMGHSKDVVAAVLDLERMVGAGRVRMWIGEEEQQMERVLGLVPFKYLLTQTQGGVAITSFVQSPESTPSDERFLVARPANEPWPTQSRETWSSTSGVAAFDNGVTESRYTFRGGQFEAAEVHQLGRTDPVFRLVASPPLPDLRRPFEGELTSEFVMDVGEEEGHGCGTVIARWIDHDDVEVRIRPVAPFWLADRPMTTHIHYRDDGTVEVVTTRDPESEATPGRCPR